MKAPTSNGSQKVTANLQLDPKVARQASALSVELGLDLSTVVNSMLIQFTKSGQLILTSLPTMTPYLEGVIKQTETDLAAGKLDTADSLEDLIRSL